MEIKYKHNPYSEKDLLLAATTSDRRLESLRQLPKFNVQPIAGPENELQTPDTMAVAQDKINFVLGILYQLDLIDAFNDQRISEETREQFIINNAPLIALIGAQLSRAEPILRIIGGDTMTGVPQLDSESQQLYFEHQGKPQTEEKVQENFIRMCQLNDMVYRVFSGAVVNIYDHRDRSNIEVKSNQRVTVHLRPKMLKYLASNRGFEEYRQFFNDFYISEAYHNNGLPPINLSDVSAGFSLPVFIKNQVVEAIDFNGQHISLAEADVDFLKKIIFAVAVGYTPSVLDKILPNAYNFIIDNWQWLEDTVKDIRSFNSYAKK